MYIHNSKNFVERFTVFSSPFDFTFFCLKYLLLRALPSDGLKYSSSMGSRSTISGLEEGSSETFMVMAEMNEIRKKTDQKDRHLFILQNVLTLK